MAPTSSKQWVLTRRPADLPTYGGEDTDFKLVTRDIPSLKDDQVLVKLLYLSNDPAQRVWAKGGERSYTEPVQIDGPMYAGGIGEVVDSKAENFKVGSLVRGRLDWTEYHVMNAKELLPLPPVPEGINLSHFLGALGGTGLTAYYGLVVVGEAKKGQKIVVSGAAGATGSMVVQIAKHIVGASEIIGMAGSDEKCRWVESLGAGKSIDFTSQRTFPSFPYLAQ
jgi:NADPH-dependent curcumin reductase CurA